MAATDGPVNKKDLEDFVALFGAPGAGVFYRASVQRDKKGRKVEAAYFPVDGEPEPEDYEAHLSGHGSSLSIVLNVPDADGRRRLVTRCAVDIDDYGAPLDELQAKLQKHSIPAVITKSKSDGAHVHLFFATPFPARDARQMVEQIGEAIGVEHADYFPKQAEVDYDYIDNPDGNKGNGLNLCCYGDERGGWADGRDLTLSEFIGRCFDARMGEDEARAIMQRLPQPKRRALARPSAHQTAADAALNASPKAPFYNGPPCLQKIADNAANGAALEHNRNNYLYNVGVYCMMSDAASDADTLAPLLLASNAKHLAQPLSRKDVNTIAKSVAKTETANYKCSEDPICSLCNKGVCNTRMFGAAMQGVRPWFSITLRRVKPTNSQTPFDPKTQLIRMTFDDPLGPDGIGLLEFDKEPNFATIRSRIRYMQLPYLDNSDAATWGAEWDVAMRIADIEWVEESDTIAAIFVQRLKMVHDQMHQNAGRMIEAYRSRGTAFPALFKPRSGKYKAHFGIGVDTLGEYMRMSYGTSDVDFLEQLRMAKKRGLIMTDYKQLNDGDSNPRWKVIQYDPIALDDWLTKGQEITLADPEDSESNVVPLRPGSEERQ